MVTVSTKYPCKKHGLIWILEPPVLKIKGSFLLKETKRAFDGLNLRLTDYESDTLLTVTCSLHKKHY